jgi:uncharacterized membrane protein
VTVALVHLAAAAYMAGVIWFVQVVHYPLFAEVPPEASAGYARVNQPRTARVVGPAMLVEGITAIWLFVDPPADLSRWLPFISGLVLAVVLLSTVLVQVPRHARLAEESSSDGLREVVASLVAGNWIRTVGWSARAALAAVIVAAV